MQAGKTALERTVDNGHHRVVDYLVNQMGVTQFDMVCNIICLYVCVQVTVAGAVYVYINIVRGVTVGGVVMTMLYMLRL